MTEKTKEELIEEIKLLQKRIAEFEMLDSEPQQEVRRLATVVRDSNDAITIQDFEGRIIAWNHGAELMYGYSEEEALQMNIERLTSPDKATEQKELTYRLITGAAVTSFETKRVTKDGRILDVWLTVTKVIDDTGTPIGVASTERDITERKKRAEELQESEYKFRRLYDSNIIGIIFWDTAGNITRANSEFLRIVGYTDDDLLTGKVRWKDMTPPEYAPLDEKALKEMAETEVVAPFEKEYIRKDGSRVPVIIGPSIFKGQKNLGICFVLDITERKKAEEALRLANAYNRSLIEVSLDPLVTIGPDGKIMDANNATEAATGYSRQELIGRDFSDYFTEPEEARCGYQQVFKEGLVHDYPLEIRHRDGHIIPVLYNASIYYDETGKVLGVFAAARDITERKKAEEAIKELNKALEQRVKQRTAELEIANEELEAFSYSVSHDLRAPLRGIDGFSQVLLEDCFDKLDARDKDYLSRVRAAVKHMSELIDNLLELSRIARQEMKFKQVDLTRLVKKAAAELREAEPERQVEFVIEEGLSVKGDERLLEIVLYNLLDNAWKFSSKHPKAKIEFGRKRIEGEDVFFMCDDGAGFDMAYVDKLFEPFQRLHSTVDFPGTGIGLVTVRRIITRHGGRLWAEGEVEKGAAFYFIVSK